MLNRMKKEWDEQPETQEEHRRRLNPASFGVLPDTMLTTGLAASVVTPDLELAADEKIVITLTRPISSSFGNNV